MSFGTAPATDNVASFNGKVEIHTSDVPNVPEPGTILDPQGQVIKGQGWMARLSDKLSEPAGASKGFVALVGIVPASLTIALTIALLLIGFGRSDQSQVEKINQGLSQQDQIIRTLDRMEQKNEKLDLRIREIERFIDRTGATRFLEENK